MGDPGWLFSLARVLYAAEIGAFSVSLKGLRNPSPRLSNSTPRTPQCMPSTAAGAATSELAADRQAWGRGWGVSIPFAAAGLVAVALGAVQASWDDSIAPSPTLGVLCAKRLQGSHDAADVGRVKAAVLQIWEQLEQEVSRVQASLPSGAALERLPQPTVTQEGEDLVVEFFIPQQLDVQGALHELRRLLRSPSFGSVQAGMAGSSVSEESSAGQAGRAWTLRRRSKSLGDLTVEVEQPRDPASHAWFAFRARGGLRERDLRLIAASMHSAMQVARRGPADAFERDFGGMFDMGPLGRMFEHIEPFLGHVQDILKDFERMQQGVEVPGQADEDEVDWGEERDTAPTPLRRPKRLEDLPGSARGHLGGAAAAGPEEEQARQARRQQARVDGVVKKLQGMGAQVFLPGKKDDFDWGILAGYEREKRQIEDTVLLALMHPAVYDDIARRTRRHYSSNRPRAVLFEGPPGTGKTTSARVIATQAAVPLVYIPLEAILSKWYGESERMLSDMLKACESFPDGCIIFLDELDSLATSRGTDMHEATRRLLGVLLRHLDGFDANKRTVVIGATNRRQDLDPALISRFSTTVTFDLPGEDCRVKILRQYAQHLSDTELLALAHATPGMAGRDLRDVCEQAERHWASKIIRGKATKGQLPPLSEYLEAAQQRLKELAGDDRPATSFV